MRLIRWGWASLFFVACSDGVTGLGTARPRDAGADAPAPTEKRMCGGPGATPGLHDEAESFARVTVRSAPPVTQRMGQTLRPGRAVVIGSDVHWAVADDRCGRSGLGVWWGAVLGRLTFDPDQDVTSSWTCLQDTWAALHLTPVRTGDALGVFFARHTALDQVANVWMPLGAGVGAVDLARRRLDTTWDVNDVALAAIAQDADGFGVTFTRAGQRFYQRLDDRLQSAGDEVLLGDEAAAGHDVPLFVHPAGDMFRSAWVTYPNNRQNVEVTTYSRAGEARGSWRVADRVGLERHLRMYASVPIEGGFVAVLDTGDVASSDTWLARFCDDGLWSMRRFARNATEAALARQGDHWVVLLARPLDGGAEQVIEAHALDEDGRRMAPAREVDAGRLGNVGDLIAAPGTRDLAALYVIVPSGTTSEARAVRVTISP